MANELITSIAHDKPHLTTENGKMYNLHVVALDGSTSILDDEDLFDGWKDHCVEPKVFHELAVKHGYAYDNETMAHVCGQFVENYLDSDWTQLNKHLPIQ